MELYRFLFFLILYAFLGYLLLICVACCCESYIKKKKEILKALRQEVETLLILKKKRERKNKTTEVDLKEKIQNLHLQNKKLRKLLHETRVEKNKYKKGKK